MYMKMLMMSRYKFKAAKMYSSGLIEYLCLPPENEIDYRSRIERLWILSYPSSSACRRQDKCRR